MSPIITRPPSPSRDQSGHAVLSSAALQAALQSLPHPSSLDTHEIHEMLPISPEKEELHPSLDIIVNSDQLYLKGTGTDVEPALLSGHVVLQLTEPTCIKEITLHFRGKARALSASSDPFGLGTAGFTYILCEHNWSFLEGEKKHGHKLKAGRHLFPFHLQVGGSLPSSVSTSALGGAFVQYKLQATASRPGLSHNFQAVLPISIIRSFAPEALEYQQSLEIENTWPGKVTYSLMIPHKAWAAGDKLTSIAKFSPLAKGARVVAITATINETVKLHSRAGHQEVTRIIATANHTIASDGAVCTDEYHHRHRVPLLHSNHETVYRIPGSTQPTSQPSAGLHSTGPGFVSPDGESSDAGPSNLVDGTDSESPIEDTADVVTGIQLTIPDWTTPTHDFEPVMISHRIRWSTSIRNHDGHMSELRCSLPLHILDHQLLQEARSLTAATRRLLLGGSDGSSVQEEEYTQLPSYPSHVRDRIPDVYSITPDHPLTPLSNMHSPHSAHHNLPSIPNSPVTPDTPGRMPLEWVTSELLRQQAAPSDIHRTGSQITPPDSRGPSSPNSRSGSRFSSRFSSRAPSPERWMQAGDATSPSSSVGNLHNTYVHSSSIASRNLPNVFHSSMKPFTPLSNPFSRTSSSSSLSSHTTNQTHTYPGPTHTRGTRHHGPDNYPETITPPLSARQSRFFTEVPDYEIASRGFAGGGVTPLTSLSGLPSYEQASQSNPAASQVGSESAGEADPVENGAREALS